MKAVAVSFSLSGRAKILLRLQASDGGGLEGSHVKVTRESLPITLALMSLVTLSRFMEPLNSIANNFKELEGIL